jgi:hypothetical protein
LSSASSLRTAGSLCLASFGILMSILRIFWNLCNDGGVLYVASINWSTVVK